MFSFSDPTAADDGGIIYTAEAQAQAQAQAETFILYGMERKSLVVSILLKSISHTISSDNDV